MSRLHVVHMLLVTVCMCVLVCSLGVGISGCEVSSFPDTGGTDNGAVDQVDNGDDTPDSPDDGNGDPDADLATLTVNIVGSGAVVRAPAGSSFAKGTQVSLEPQADANWRFDHWEGDVSGYGQDGSVIMHDDRTVTAVFVVVTTVTPGTTDCALFDRIWYTGDNPGWSIKNACLSGDGSRIAMVTQDTTAPYTKHMRIMDIDGSNQVSAALPADTSAIYSMDTDADGSVAYCQSAHSYLYKFQGGSITEIFRPSDQAGVGDVSDIKTTALGDWVYFLDDEPDNNDIWRVSSNGTACELIINDTAVQRNEGSGMQVASFDISNDGSRIAFTMYGYRKSDGGVVTKEELFVKNGSDIIQLTDTTPATYTIHPIISGNGQIVVADKNGTWTAYGWAGTWSKELTAAGYNFGGMGITNTGNKVFYNDAKGGGGSFALTNQAGIMHAMPAWNITNIAVHAHSMIDLSDDGLVCCFRVSYGAFPEHAAFYVGRFTSTADTADAPNFGLLRLSPGVIPCGNPLTRMKLFAQVMDPQGSSDVTKMSVDRLIDDRHESDNQKVIVRFFSGPRNDGDGGDEAVDDVWTAVADQAGGAQTVDRMTLRINAMDSTGTVRSCDVTLLADRPADESPRRGGF